jgi:hypothetical protein
MNTINRGRSISKGQENVPNQGQKPGTSPDGAELS